MDFFEANWEREREKKGSIKYPSFTTKGLKKKKIQSSRCMGGSTKSQKAGRLKRLEAKIVKKPASYRDYVET